MQPLQETVRRMCIFTLMALFIPFFSLAAHAGPRHVLTALPRAVGRTAENMVTFKDRGLALRQWILIAAVLANGGSDIDLYHRCPNCYELDAFVYGLRPSAGRLFGIELVAGMGYATTQQVAWESSSEGHSLAWRGIERWAPTMAPVLAYSWFTYRNTTIPSDGSRTIGSSWLFPN